MADEIRIYGRDHHGPWEVERVDGEESTERKIVRSFGDLGSEVIDLLGGRKQHYRLNYISSNGLSPHILTDSQEEVLLYIMDSHNRTVKQISQLEESL